MARAVVRGRARGRRPHALLLAFHFPPARGSGVYRIRAWANALYAAGMDVTVLTCHPDFHRRLTGVDESGLDDVDPGVAIHPFRFPFQYLVSDIAEMSWLHANLPEAYTALWNRLPEVAFPERYGHALPLIVASGLRINATRPVDIVVASGNPYVQLGAASVLSRAIRRPYVVDYHDAWTMDQFTGEDRYAAGHRAWRWEEQIISRAGAVITVNPPLAAWYRRRYPAAEERVHVVENGLDDEVLATPVGPAPQGRPVRVGYVGTIRTDLPLAETIEGWSQARASDPGMAEATLTLHGHVGFWRAGGAVARTQLSRGADVGISYRGPVAHRALAQTYAAYDALCLLLPSSPYVTSGKAYDYLGSGLPVLGIFDTRNDTTRVFRDSPLYTGVSSLAADEVAAGFLRLRDLAGRRSAADVERTRRAAARYTWSRQMDVAVALVQDVMRRKAPA